MRPPAGARRQAAVVQHQAAVAPGERAARRQALPRQRLARRQPAEPRPEAGRPRVQWAAVAATPVPPKRREPRSAARIRGAAARWPGATAGSPAGARCWRLAPWWRQNFGVWSAATISRRDWVSETAGEARARDGFPLVARECTPARGCARRSPFLPRVQTHRLLVSVIL